MIETGIDGLIMLELPTHSDERGFFREIIRNKDLSTPFEINQLSHSLVNTGITKGWHGHKNQSQMTYLASGSAIFVFVDMRDSDTNPAKFEYLASPHSNPWVVITKPGIYIGYYCTQGPANVLYATSGTYDTDDELRIPHDDPRINYPWEQWKEIR
jgi:dTDP-4-dehydrorhamnose 3,5-epimerase